MALKIEVIDKKRPERLVLRISGVSAAFANALRRAIITDLPTFAIDEVDFFENNSCMFNDYLANRLALVPLTYDEEVSDDAKIAFAVDKEGPCTVYSRDMKSADDKIKVFCQNIPIIKLAEKQRLRFEAVAVKGTMRQHAKFQCALASYSIVPELKVKKGSELAKAVEACPRKVFNEKGEAVKIDACDLCNACAEAAPDCVEVKPKENEFLFFIESYNNITAAEHLKKALSILEEKTSALVKELK